MEQMLGDATFRMGLWIKCYIGNIRSNGSLQIEGIEHRWEYIATC